MQLLLRQPVLLFVSVAVVLIASNLIGYKLASYTAVNDDHRRHEHISGLREGLFVLLGLLLGFTVAMVLPRYDERRDLVGEEAHAIDTLQLRSDLLPEPQRSKSTDLLQQYVGARLDFARATMLDASALEKTVLQTHILQQQLWSEAVAVGAQDHTAVMAAYLKALDDMIGVAEKRLGAFESRVPEAVWVIILLVAAFQSFVAGYSLPQKFWLSHLVAPLIIAVVVGLIADLDDPHTGLVRVSQASMERLARNMTHQ